MPTLHIHADESGDFTFSSSGTTYYVFVVTWTYDPAPLASALTALRFELLKQGHDLPHFHATEDSYTTRDAVFQTLADIPDWHFAGVVIEKRKVNPSIRARTKFYPKFLSSPLRFVLRGSAAAGADRIMVFTDRLPIQKHRKGVEKAIKQSIADEIQPGIPFHVYHHPCESNCWLQVADYCCWALFRKWESGNDSYYRRLTPRLEAPELDALCFGTTYYY